jgi:hypothetical protein
VYYKHGQSKTPVYKVWIAMKDRCYNSNNDEFHNYGGRGITVCSRWREDFVAFAQDMGPRPPGGEIERLVNSEGYGPLNCEWTTRRKQTHNTRHNRNITIDGVTKCLAEWAEIYGISPLTVASRINTYGWSEVEAVTIALYRRK